MFEDDTRQFMARHGLAKPRSEQDAPLVGVIIAITSLLAILLAIAMVLGDWWRF